MQFIKIMLGHQTNIEWFRHIIRWISNNNIAYYCTLLVYVSNNFELKRWLSYISVLHIVTASQFKNKHNHAVQFNLQKNIRDWIYLHSLYYSIERTKKVEEWTNWNECLTLIRLKLHCDTITSLFYWYRFS